tara:strand:- start:13704 stop:14765 length:1062 start_codon:yes stop_codon:yes gene_type:complete
MISTWVYLGPIDIDSATPDSEQMLKHSFQLVLKEGLRDAADALVIEISDARPEYHLLTEETLLKQMVSSRIVESRHQQYVASLGIPKDNEPEPDSEMEAHIHLAGRRYRFCNLYNSNELRTSLTLQEPLNLVLAYPFSAHDIELLANFTFNLGLAMGPESGVNADFLQPLTGKENLKSLSLILAALPEPLSEFLEWIQSLVGLENLRLMGPKFTAEIGDSLKKLPQLKALEIRYTKITAEILVPLQACSSLIMLDMRDNPKLTDQFFEITTSWPLLRELNLGNTAISDSSVKSLLHLTQLEILNLENTKITDQSLPILKQMTQLTSLDIRGTNVSLIGALDLFHSLKDCLVRC